MVTLHNPYKKVVHPPPPKSPAAVEDGSSLDPGPPVAPLASTTRTPVVTAGTAHAGSDVMGVQSQHRKKATRGMKNKPKYQEKHNEKKRDQDSVNQDGTFKKLKIGPKQKTQISLFGTRAFDSSRDCEICVAKQYCKETGQGTVPHRTHHIKCSFYRSPKEKEAAREEKKLLKLNKGLSAKDRGTMKGIRKEDGEAFFGPKDPPPSSNQFGLKPPPTPATSSPIKPSGVGPVDNVPMHSPSVPDDPPEDVPEESPEAKLYKHVSDYCNDPLNASEKAPLAVCAIADYVRRHMIPSSAFSKTTNQYPDTEYTRNKLSCLQRYFPTQSMTMTVPKHRVPGECPNPFYHSVEGQDFLVVFWQLHFPGLVICCPSCGEGSNLVVDRAKFSSNKDLFPIFHMHKPPSWAMLMQYKCSSCKKVFQANDGNLLASLPAFVRDAYPATPKWCTSSKKYHLDRHITTMLEGETMLTNMNGEAFSRLLYHAINQEYLRKAECYASYIAAAKANGVIASDFVPQKYPNKDVKKEGK